MLLQGLPQIRNPNIVSHLTESPPYTRCSSYAISCKNDHHIKSLYRHLIIEPFTCIVSPELVGTHKIL